jgi:hypothetical protein
MLASLAPPASHPSPRAPRYAEQSADEVAALEEAKTRLGIKRDEREHSSVGFGDGFKEIDSPDIRVSMSTKMSNGNSNIIMRASTVIDCTLEEAAAQVFYVDSRRNCKNAYTTGCLERIIREENDHRVVYYNAYEHHPSESGPPSNSNSSRFTRRYDLGITGFDARDWLSLWCWKRTDEDTIEMFAIPHDHDDFPITSKYLRAET